MTTAVKIQCTRCRVPKPTSQFGVRSDTGHSNSWCIECTADYQYRLLLLKRYKMTPEEYDAKLRAQGGVCAICGGLPGHRRLVVDHDHSCCPGRVTCGECNRGLICYECNMALGKMHDSIEVVRAALAYLESYDA